jgi:3-hydroxy acid dehydrogenase/malonic semialdehyde reductase
MKECVLITGASSGFGAATAKRFGEEGHKLLLLARRAEKLQALAEELNESGAEIVPLVGDVRNHDDLTQLLAPYASEITILVNNAGLALGLEPAHQADLSDWETMIDTNIKGLTYVTKIVLPHMVEENRGLIINIGSVAGTYPYPGGNAYGGTKAFVKQFSLNLKADLLGTAVRVTNIEPAAAETEFSLTRMKGDAEKAHSVYEGWEPFTADDVAETISWISHLPTRVNINSIEIMGTGQSFGSFRFAKE